VLGVTETADRVPPAQAYMISEQAMRGGNALTARWQKLQRTQVAALDGLLRAANIPALMR
jgi:hypothetical protein